MLSCTILSGGLDSSTLAYFMQKEMQAEQHLISFNYGQRHKRELESATKIAKQLGCRHSIIDISSVLPLLHSSALTDNVAVPEGHYEEENMKLTVVPNRNAIMLSIAYGAAVADKADVVVFGAHSGDHAVYPDCRNDFVNALTSALEIGNQTPGISIEAPFVKWKKSQILAWGLAAGVPYELTYTCYNGGEIACGSCSTCVERLESFAICNTEDPLEYEDRNYWKEAVARFNMKKFTDKVVDTIQE